MKIYICSFILISGAISAQISPEKPLKLDSAKFHKIDPYIMVNPTEVLKFETSSIARLCKMPIAKPKNPKVYSSLKAIKKDTTLYKIPNLFDKTKPSKLAAK